MAKINIFAEKTYLCVSCKDKAHAQYKTAYRPFKTEGLHRDIRLSDECE